MKKLLIFSSIFLIVPIVKAQSSRYKISGSLNGFADSTLIYLEYVIPGGVGRHLDSSYITNGNFSFSGSLEANVVQALLRTKDFSDYRFLWLENSEIRFTSVQGKFREALVLGSKTENEAAELNTAIKTVNDEKKASINFIESHPNSLISAYVLNVYATSWGRETASKLYNSLTTEIKSTVFGQSVAEFISVNKDIKPGDSFVDFEQANTEGKVIRLSDFKGKVILLEFWGSWCLPCRKGNLELVQVYKEYKNKGFEIIGVGAETNKEAWLKAIKIDRLTWPNVTDLKGQKNRAVLIYGVSEFPTNFLIDKSGRIVSKNLHGEELKKALNKLLN